MGIHNLLCDVEQYLKDVLLFGQSFPMFDSHLEDLLDPTTESHVVDMMHVPNPDYTFLTDESNGFARFRKALLVKCVNEGLGGFWVANNEHGQYEPSITAMKRYMEMDAYWQQVGAIYAG